MPEQRTTFHADEHHVSPPILIGVDLSLTGTGIATLAGHRTVHTNAADPVETRLATIRNAVLEHVYQDIGGRYAGADLFILEDFVTRSPAASTLGMVHGVVRLALAETGAPFVLVPPATLKKYVTGKGNAKKPDMRMETFKRFHVDLDDDNQCDAYGLRAMAFDAYGFPLASMPAAQRESLDKIAWPELRRAA